MPEPLLQVRSLSYTYSDGTAALRGVDLALHAGERVGLIGPNGSGKSTLLLCMSGLFKANGSIRLNSTELTDKRGSEAFCSKRPSDRSGKRLLTPFSRAAAGENTCANIGIVFQSPDDQLFMPTLADDLAFGPMNLGLPETEVHRRVHRVAEEMGLAEMLDRAPHHLSMGQKRNAAIATVLAMRPPVLLLDEPSSNLDPRSRRQLLEVLGRIEAAMLIASHDLALVGRLCSRVAVIDGGRIVADGPSAGILGNAALMEQHGLEAWSEHPARLS